MSLLNEYGLSLLAALATTFMLAIASWLMAFTTALLLTLLRLTGIRSAGFIVTAFIEYQRNIPPLVHIFLWYFGVSSLLPDSIQNVINASHGEFIFAAIAVGLYYAAYFAEDIRSGLRSIPQGQYEAARAIGLGDIGTLRYVILPQALRVSVPPLISQTVLLLKTTSLAMVIGVMELTYVTKEIASDTFRVFEIYGISTAMYVFSALTLLLVGNRLSCRIQGRRG